MAETQTSPHPQELVLYAHGEGFCTITLNRPEKLNSFNEEVHQALHKALDKVSLDRSIRSLILTGAGRGFCAGQDLSDRRVEPGSIDLTKTVGKFYNPLILQLRNLPFPTVCAVNGAAVGAGASIAFACDIVVAARSAKFVQGFSKVGLIPDSGGTWALPRLAGRGKAFALAALSETVSAEEAESLGLIWKVVDDEQLMPAAQDTAKKLAALPTRALVKLRQLFDAGENNDLDAQLELERIAQGELGRAPDYAEGVHAFFEKRPPKFSQR